MLFTPKKLDLNEADSTDNVTKENKPSTPQKTPEIQNEPKTPEPKNEPKTPEKTPERKLRRRTTGNMTPKQRLHRYVRTQAGLQIGALNLASDWLSLFQPPFYWWRPDSSQHQIESPPQQPEYLFFTSYLITYF